MTALFSAPTTVIVGAGASADFGAPLASELWSGVVRSCSALGQARQKHESGGYRKTADQFLKEIKRDNPGGYAYLSAVRSEDDDLRTLPRQIAEQVNRANVHTSVDDFLRDHPKLIGPLRTLIADEIFKGLYSIDREDHSVWHLRRECFAYEFQNVREGSGPVRNWIRLFSGVCRPLVRRAREISPVCVISFNYDRLFETVLSSFWNSSEVEYPPFADCFRFLYPYGSFSDLPEKVTDAGQWLSLQAKGIGLAGSGSTSIDELRVAIANSRQIFALGFSFSEANSQLLGLHDQLGTRIFAQNYNGNDKRLSRVLQSLHAKPADFGSLPDLLVNGFFEQPAPPLPSEPFILT